MPHLQKSNLKPSSRQWLNRQLHDPYVKLAKQQGYRARSAYKLLELDQRFRLLKKSACVVDLGSSPGSWLQVLQQKIGKGGTIIGIDLLPTEPIPHTTIIQADFLTPSGLNQLAQSLNGQLLDGVLSDMAANTTGHQKTDQLRTAHLAEMAWQFAKTHLKPGGFFVTKIFQGGMPTALLTELKFHFQTIKHAKPKSSRTGSIEQYLVAKGFKPPSKPKNPIKKIAPSKKIIKKNYLADW